jgi:deoxyadenosine/deoxycytidine kinase
MISAFSIVGPHGVGKTTAIRELIETLPSLTLHPGKSIAIPDDFEPFLRAWLRISKYALDAIELRAIATGGNTYLLDRCVFDVMAYADAYRSLGWVTAQQHDLLAGAIDVVTNAGLYPSHVAVLMAPVSTIRERLERRWPACGKRWREENCEYLDAVCHAYEQLPANICRRYSIRPTIFIIDARGDMLTELTAIACAAPL